MCCEIFEIASEVVATSSKAANIVKYASASVEIADLDFDSHESQDLGSGESKMNLTLHRAIVQMEVRTSSQHLLFTDIFEESHFKLAGNWWGGAPLSNCSAAACDLTLLFVPFRIAR